jgi:hypothetical protein
MNTIKGDKLIVRDEINMQKIMDLDIAENYNKITLLRSKNKN